LTIYGTTRPGPIKKALRNNQSAFEEILKLFFDAQDRVFGRFGHAELHDFLGLDLDRLAGRRIPAHPGFAIDQNELAESWDGERVLGMFVG